MAYMCNGMKVGDGYQASMLALVAHATMPEIVADTQGGPVALLQVAERAKTYAASENGPSFAAETDRRPTLYVVDPKGAFKHAWMLQVRTTDDLQGRVLPTSQCVLFMVLPGHALHIPDRVCGLPHSRSGSVMLLTIRDTSCNRGGDLGSAMLCDCRVSSAAMSTVA